MNNNLLNQVYKSIENAKCFIYDKDFKKVSLKKYHHKLSIGCDCGIVSNRYPDNLWLPIDDFECVFAFQFEKLHEFSIYPGLSDNEEKLYEYGSTYGSDNDDLVKNMTLDKLNAYIRYLNKIMVFQ